MSTDRQFLPQAAYPSRLLQPMLRKSKEDLTELVHSDSTSTRERNAAIYVLCGKTSTKGLIEIVKDGSASIEEQNTAISFLITRVRPRRLQKLSIIEPNIADRIVNERLERINPKIKLAWDRFLGGVLVALLIIGCAVATLVVHNYSEAWAVILVSVAGFVAFSFFFVVKGHRLLLSGFKLLFLLLVRWNTERE